MPVTVRRRRRNEQRRRRRRLLEERGREQPGLQPASALSAIASTVTRADRSSATARRTAPSRRTPHRDRATVRRTVWPVLTSERNCSGTVRSPARDRSGPRSRPSCRADVVRPWTPAASAPIPEKGARTTVSAARTLRARSTARRARLQRAERLLRGVLRRSGIAGARLQPASGAGRTRPARRPSGRAATYAVEVRLGPVERRFRVQHVRHLQRNRRLAATSPSRASSCAAFRVGLKERRVRFRRRHADQDGAGGDTRAALDRRRDDASAVSAATSACSLAPANPVTQGNDRSAGSRLGRPVMATARVPRERLRSCVHRCSQREQRRRKCVADSMRKNGTNDLTALPRSRPSTLLGTTVSLSPRERARGDLSARRVEGSV